MTLSELEQIIKEERVPDISHRFELKAVVDQYPYFQSGIFIYLKCLFAADDVLFRKELQRLSVFLKDRRALFYYIFDNEYKRFFRKKGKRKEIDKNRTDILLNAFFETLDDSAIDIQIDSLAPRIENQITDYFAYIGYEHQFGETPESPDGQHSLKHQHIIDRFIDNADQYSVIRFDPEKENIHEQQVETSENGVAEELQDDLFFTETLAGIYIKQHKYERAFEIIERLSLNYPEKNIYFANQISFLKKLIINSNVKNKREK